MRTASLVKARPSAASPAKGASLSYRLGAACLCLALLLVEGCGTANNSTSPCMSNGACSLALAGPSQIAVGQTGQFAATVSGTNNAAVTWAVNSSSGGSTGAGTITSGGLYTAPASVPSGGKVTISAASVVNTLVANQQLVTIVSAASPGSSGTTPTVTWAAPSSIVYGTGLSATQLDATASASGSFSYTPAAGSVLGAGTHTLTAVFTPDAGGAPITTTASLTVTKATPAITWAVPAAVPDGTTLTTVQLDATSSVPGSFTYMPKAGTVLAASQTLSTVLTPTDSADYNPATATVPVTVDAAGPASVVQLSAATYATSENAGWFTVQLTRTGSASGAASVNYATADGTALAGTGYGATAGVLSWADGDTSPKSFTVPILDQHLTAGSQAFQVSLSTPSLDVSLGSPATASVTINDTDAALVDVCAAQAAGADATATFCTTPNFPLYGTPNYPQYGLKSLPLPANPNAHLGDGLALAPSASNLFSLVMGTAVPGANMVTGQSVRDTFFLNYIFGNVSSAFGSPVDTGQANNSVFAAVARHYEVGDANDVHLLTTDGLHLRAMCSQNRTDCSPGKVWAGMIRLPAEIRPGMTIKVRYQGPAGKYSWAPTWLFTGSEYSPGPGGNPWIDFGAQTSLLRYGGAGDAFEIDLNDNYPRWTNTPTVATGYQLDFGTPDNSGVPWHVAPHFVYWANGSGYTYQTQTDPSFEQLPVNWSSGFHDLVLSWETDNLMYEFVDGKLVVASYMEYPASTYVDGLDNNATKQLAMNMMIGNQAIPNWLLYNGNTVDNDGIPDGWTMVVQEISVWNGNVVNPSSYEPAANGCDATCQAQSH